MRKFYQAAPDRHVELAIALLIAVFAIAQFVDSCSNNRSNAKQVGQIISATNSIKASAEQFSTSADGINKGVSDAVEKLNNQVSQLTRGSDQTARLASATERSNANVTDADRPWMSSMLSVSNFEIGKKPIFTWTYTNSGKRPAKITLQANREQMLSGFPKVPDSSYLLGATGSTNFIVPGQSMFAVSELDQTLTKETFDFLEQHPQVQFFAFAKVEYVDVKTNAKYWTHMCARYIPKMRSLANSGFLNCAEYNDAK